MLNFYALTSSSCKALAIAVGISVFFTECEEERTKTGCRPQAITRPVSVANKRETDGPDVAESAPPAHVAQTNRSLGVRGVEATRIGGHPNSDSPPPFPFLSLNKSQIATNPSDDTATSTPGRARIHTSVTIDAQPPILTTVGVQAPLTKRATLPSE